MYVANFRSLAGLEVAEKFEGDGFQVATVSNLNEAAFILLNIIAFRERLC